MNARNVRSSRPVFRVRGSTGVASSMPGVDYSRLRWSRIKFATLQLVLFAPFADLVRVSRYGLRNLLVRSCCLRTTAPLTVTRMWWIARHLGFVRTSLTCVHASARSWIALIGFLACMAKSSIWITVFVRSFVCLFVVPYSFCCKSYSYVTK